MKKILTIISVSLVIFVVSSVSVFAGPLTRTLDWDTSTWTTGELNNEYVIDNNTIDITIEATSGFNGAGTGFFYQGDKPSTNLERTVISAVDLNTFGTNNTVTYTIDLGRAGEGLKDVNFKLFDVDGDDGNTYFRQEKYVITGYLDGNIVNPTLSGDSDVHQITGNTVLGMKAVRPNFLAPTQGVESTKGVLGVSFSQPVDKVVIVFSINEGSVTDQGSTPGFGIHDINFDKWLYNVQFNPGIGGAFDLVDHTDLEYGSDTPVPPETLAKPGFIFTGWDIDISDIVTGNVVYTALWEQIDYTVTYLPGDGGAFESVVNEGLHYGDTTPIAPETIALPGYEFTGWDIEIADTVTGDATYTALWKQIDYTVTYLPGDGGDFESVINEGLHYGDTTPTAPETKAKSGYKFIGWDISITDTVTGDATYTALWEKVEAETDGSGDGDKSGETAKKVLPKTGNFEIIAIGVTMILSGGALGTYALRKRKK